MTRTFTLLLKRYVNACCLLLTDTFVIFIYLFVVYSLYLLWYITIDAIEKTISVKVEKVEYA